MLNVNGASSVSYSWDNVGWFESNQSVVLNQGIYVMQVKVKYAVNIMLLTVKLP